MSPALRILANNLLPARAVDQVHADIGQTARLFRIAGIARRRCEPHSNDALHSLWVEMAATHLRLALADLLDGKPAWRHENCADSYLAKLGIDPCMTRFGSPAAD